MKHRGLRDPNWTPDDPEGDDYSPQELEKNLKEWFGGDLWRVWHRDVTIPGAELYARYTKNELGRFVLSGLVMLGEAIPAEVLRKVPVAALENSINISQDTVREEVDKLPPLRRTPGMDPVEFSRLVAEHFKTWTRPFPHPPAAMAADADTKVTTVHGWIREARLRGFLPPARRGKADLGDRFERQRELEEAQAALDEAKA
ncbi:hypothetical protein, partial [Micromonospora harpali]